MFNRFVILLLLLVGVLQCFANSADLLLVETFDQDPFQSGKWGVSNADKYRNQPIKVMPARQAGKGFEKDNGVQLTQEMKHYGFGSVFSSPVDTKDKDLIVQYEVKFEDTFNCGGAYIKLLRELPDNAISSLTSDTPYSIMFGPDKCGATNKVHFIVQFQNPVTKKWEEKHFNETIPVKADHNTHLYSLILRKDNTFRILVDNKSVKQGSLLTHFEPAINPPEQIFDPTDKKPADWVDDETISDPDAKKPDDWDEDQPRKIPDTISKKPEGWLDDEPLEIPNPEISKPEDWDDEEDGEWEAPLIPNPKCDAVGCGPWSPPMIPNPLYKGKWVAPKIPNPAFKGVWKPRLIPNPEYFHDSNPINSLAPMLGLAVEIWTTNAGIHFDNFVVSHSEEAVKSFTANTFHLKNEAESQKSKDEKRAKREQDFKDKMENGTFAEKVRVITIFVADYLAENPVALAASIAAIVLPFIYLVLFGGRSAKKSKHEASEDESPAVVEKKENNDTEPTTGEEQK